MNAGIKAASRANALHILIAASVMMSLAMGMRQCLGLFLPPMTEALAMSASDFTFAIAVQNIVWGLAQAPLGAVADRWGLRPVMVLGAAAYVAAMAVMASATGISTFILAQSLIGIGIACTGSSLAMTAAARVANPKVPANTAAELVALARREPGKLTYSSAGIGSGLCWHCQRPGEFREADLLQAIHRFSRNRPMFSLS